MNRIFLGVVVAVVVLLAGGVVFLGTYQQAPSTTKMEVQIPNDRLSLQ
jgi:cell division protein FtsN